MTRVNIEVPQDVHKAAKLFCAKEGITLTDFVIKAILEEVKKR